MALPELTPAWLIETIHACRSRNEATRKRAWNELAERVFPHVQRIAIREQRRLGFTYPSTAIAEDVAIDAFIKLVHNVHRITDAAGLLAWFHTVIQNRLRDLGRSQYIQREILTDEVRDSRRAPDVNVRHDDLYAAIQKLPPEKREVLYAMYWLGLSASEIAAREGVPLGTIKSRISYSYAALRKLLAQQQEP